MEMSFTTVKPGKFERKCPYVSLTGFHDIVKIIHLIYKMNN